MIALTFTDACVYIVDCAGGGGRMTVQQFAQAPLPEGAVQNGAVADAKLVRAALEQAFAAHGFGKVREVTITAVSTLASNSEYVLPYTTNRKHLETMLRAEVMQALTGSDYVFDYTEETVFEDEGVQKCRVNVYVLPQSMVKGYEELLDDMGIKRRSFDAEKNCLLRFSQYFNADFTGAVLVYADEKVATLVAMCENGSTIMRRYPLHMADTREQAYEEMALQIVKISQFKQISLPGSRVEAVYLFGSQVDAQAVADVREICGYATAILGQPGALRAPEGFEF